MVEKKTLYISVFLLLTLWAGFTLFSSAKVVCHDTPERFVYLQPKHHQMRTCTPTFPKDSVQHPTELETKFTDQTSIPLSFLDPITCQISTASFAGESWLREAGISSSSGATSRLRQLAYGITLAASLLRRDNFSCLLDLKKLNVSIFNTETSSPIHNVLSSMNLHQYIASEYFPGQNKSGSYVNGIRHEDLMALSFPNNSFDFVLTTEVFEHIPFPYDAHKEVFRVLKDGGTHIFTVPFMEGSEHDIIMSKMDRLTGHISHGPGQPPHYIPPLYHLDPLREDGVLVFTIFGEEMMEHLCSIGFSVKARYLYLPQYGILGRGNILFLATKVIQNES